MSIYSDKVNGHVVWGVLDNILQIIDNLRISDVGILEQLSRIERVISELKVRLKNIPPDLMSFSLLDEITRKATNIRTKLTNYSNTKNQENLEKIETSLEILLEYLYQLYVYRVSSSTTIIQDNYESFIKKITEKYRQLNSYIKDLENKIKDQHTEIDRISKLVSVTKDKCDNEIMKFNKKSSEEHQKQFNKFSSLLNDIKNRSKNEEQQITNKLNSLLSNIKIDNKANFIEAAREYAKIRDKKIEEVNKQIEAINAKYEVQSRAFVNDYNELYENLENKNAEADVILEAISTKSTTRNYNQEAQKQHIWSKWLRYGSIALLLALVGGAVWIYIDIVKVNLDWQIALVRVVILLLISYPATYLARQSKMHNDLAVMLKKKELELATINSFIALLDIDKQKEIKAQLVDKYFGHFEETKPDKDEHDLTIGLFSQFIDIIKKLKI